MMLLTKDGVLSQQLRATCLCGGFPPCKVSTEVSKSSPRFDVHPGARRSRLGLELEMEKIRPSRMIGHFCRSWPSPMAPMRMSCRASAFHLLPFVHVLSYGSCDNYRSVEDFSYFTLRRHHTSVFAISCTRQMDAKDLKERPKDVTRSTVQKAVVVVAESLKWFRQLREKLSMVTEAWFAQRYEATSCFSQENRFLHGDAHWAAETSRTWIS